MTGRRVKGGEGLEMGNGGKWLRVGGKGRGGGKGEGSRLGKRGGGGGKEEVKWGRVKVGNKEVWLEVGKRGMVRKVEGLMVGKGERVRGGGKG